MTLYLLDTDQQKCAEYLDDNSLDRMIKDIAQVLCNANHLDSDYIDDPDYFDDAIPLSYNLHAIKNKPLTEWSIWTSKCKANYFWLIQLGLSCLDEASIRCGGKIINNNQYQRYLKIILWARDNIPDLPSTFSKSLNRETNLETTPFPIEIPKKYLKFYPYDQVNIIESYRNYYQAKVKKKTDDLITDEPNVELRQKRKFQICNIFWTRREKPDWLILEK